MKNILAIDYGLSKIGLAISQSNLSSPLTTIKEKDTQKLVEKIKKFIDLYSIELIVLGISEGQMAKKTKEFGEILKNNTNCEIMYQDETLTTQDAIKMSQSAGIRRSKRKRNENSFAAALILESYLESL